jgi:hypothetical protein
VEQFGKGVLLYEALSLTDSATLTILIPIMESTDGEPGIYARVLDSELNILNKPRYDARHEKGLLEFLEP